MARDRLYVKRLLCAPCHVVGVDVIHVSEWETCRFTSQVNTIVWLLLVGWKSRARGGGCIV